jgi:hypothetical protein
MARVNQLAISEIKLGEMLEKGSIQCQTLGSTGLGPLWPV